MDYLLSAMSAVWIVFILFILVMFFWFFRKSPIRGWLLLLALPFFAYISLLLYTVIWQIEPEDRDSAFLNFFYSPYTGRGALASLFIPLLFQIPLIGFGYSWKRMLWNPKKTAFDYCELGMLSLLSLLFLGLTIAFMYFDYLALKQDIL